MTARIGLSFQLCFVHERPHVDHLHAEGPLARFGHEGNDGIPAAPEHRRTHLSLADLGSTQRHERGHFGTSALAGLDRMRAA
jgi:hypothetical protein